MAKEFLRKRKMIRLSTLLLPIAFIPVSMASDCEKPNHPVLISDEGYIYVEWSDETVSIMGFENMGTEVHIPETINGMKVVGLGYEKPSGGLWGGYIEVPCEGAGITKLIFDKMSDEFNKGHDNIHANFPDVETVEYIDPLTHGKTYDLWKVPPPTNAKTYDIDIKYELRADLPALKTIKISSGENNNMRNDTSVNLVYINRLNKVKYELPDNIFSTPGLIIGTSVYEAEDTWADNWCGNNKVFVNVSWSDFAKKTQPQ